MSGIFRYLVIALFAGSMLTAAPVVHAEQDDALELVRTTTDQLLNEFEKNRSDYEADKNELFAMVERIAIPRFDFVRMTRLVLGRHSRSATESEFNAFMGEFKTLLVRTYATALFQYTGQNIKYAPQINEAKYKIVQATVQLDRVEPVVIEYYLAERDGKLMVFDVSIDGISLVTNYRSSYNAVIRSKGLQVLIDDLAAKNSTRVQ